MCLRSVHFQTLCFEITFYGLYPKSFPSECVSPPVPDCGVCESKKNFGAHWSNGDFHSINTIYYNSSYNCVSDFLV
jgi:hypothetical protein